MFDFFFNQSFTNEEDHRKDGLKARQILATVIQRNSSQKLAYLLTVPQMELIRMLSQKQKMLEVEKFVSSFFNGDETKIKQWWNSPNPMLGDIKPIDSKFEAVEKLVMEAKEQNGPWD